MKKIIAPLILSLTAHAYAESDRDLVHNNHHKMMGVNAIVIGDSLSDIKNNTWVVTDGRKPPFQGAPVTNWPNDQPGEMWPDFLAESLSPDGETITLEEASDCTLNGGCMDKVIVAAYA